MANIGEMLGAAPTSTFLGLAAGRLDAVEPGIGILGVPAATPYAATGAYCAHAPTAIRAAIAPYSASRHHMDFDLGRPLVSEAGTPIRDYGDLGWALRDHAANRERIRASVASLIAGGAVPVILGGDDSVPIPVIQALATGGPLDILQIDAHIDWRDEVGGERMGLSSTMRRASEMPGVRHIVQVGQRAIGSARPQDYDDACKHGVTFFSARAIHTAGVGQALHRLEPGARLYINLDVDGLDPSVMPAVIGPAPGGLRFDQVNELLHGAAARCHIAGFSIVELMPERDRDGLSALTAARLVCNVLGLLGRS